MDKELERKYIAFMDGLESLTRQTGIAIRSLDTIGLTPITPKLSSSYTSDNAFTNIIFAQDFDAVKSNELSYDDVWHIHDSLGTKQIVEMPWDEKPTKTQITLKHTPLGE